MSFGNGNGGYEGNVDILDENQCLLSTRAVFFCVPLFHREISITLIAV